MDIKEFINATSKAFNEKLNSPLFGAFIISWIVWNWDIIYITVFISGDVTQLSENQKIILIPKFVYISKLVKDHFHILWNPLITAIIGILVYPLVSLGAYWISMKYDIIKKKMKDSIYQNLKISASERIKAKELYKKESNKLFLLLDEKDEIIKKLNSEGSEIDQDKVKQRNELFTFLENKDITIDFIRFINEHKKSDAIYINSDPNQQSNTKEELIKKLIDNDLLIKENENKYHYSVKGLYFINEIKRFYNIKQTLLSTYFYQADL